MTICQPLVNYVCCGHFCARIATRLLRARRKRPCRRAAEQRDELAPLHYSITSSAIARSEGGTVRPIALAALRFTTISNFVGN